MINSSKGDSKLNPELKEKLLKESKNPWLGLRRTLWLLFLASSSLGILIMGTKFISGEKVPLSDLIVQFSAILIFGGLVWFDRNKDVKDLK